MLWLLGLVIAFSGLCIWLELGCMIPRSGGEKVYLEAVYRKPKLLATTIFAMYAVVLGFTAASCIVFAEYVIAAAGKEATEWYDNGALTYCLCKMRSDLCTFPNLGSNEALPLR